MRLPKANASVHTDPTFKSTLPDWLDESNPEYELLNAVRYWLGKESWSFEEAVWIVVGVFRLRTELPIRGFKLGCDSRWKHTAVVAMPAEIKRFEKVLEVRWGAAEYDLSPQNPHEWVRYAVETEEKLGWIAFGMSHPKLIKIVEPYDALVRRLMVSSCTRVPANAPSPDLASLAKRQKGKAGRKPSLIGLEAAKKLEKMTTEDLETHTGESLASHLKVCRTWAAELQKRELKRRIANTKTAN